MLRPVAGLSALIAASVLAAAPATAAVTRGPAGVAFYTPPSALPKGPHGTPIWQRKLTGPAVLAGAKSNTLLLYRSQAVDGATVAVSGTVAVPKGKAPKGGWPVVSWAHGTIGIADACAPSKVAMPGKYDQPLLSSWLKAGFAVVRTDYEGLGTPGTHPYLNGTSEGRSVLDIVRAARKLDPSIGKRTIIAGHSQGGQAALFAASLAKQWTPELTLRGTLAFAPVSHLSEQAGLLQALTTPGQLGALAAMIVRGVEITNPGLNVPGVLSERATALWPQTDERCLTQLGQGDSFGGLSPADLFAPGANLAPLIGALNAQDDPEELKVPGPLRIEQGTADTTVFPQFTQQLQSELKAKGAKQLTYKTYKDLDHITIVLSKAPAADATKWVKSRG